MIRYEESLSALRKYIVYCFSENVCISYAVPDIENGIRTDRVFLYSRAQDTTRRRPFAALSTAASDGRMLRYEDCAVCDLMDPPVPVDAKLSYALPEKESVKDLRMEQAMIRKMYEGVRLFAFAEELRKEERELLEKYLFIFEHAVPKDLMPYYRALSARFWEWAEKYR